MSGSISYREEDRFRVLPVSFLRELQVFGESASQVDLFEGAFADHAVETDAVEQECPQVERSVAVVGGGEPHSHVNNHRTVQAGRDADGFGKNCLDPYFRVGHQGVASHGSFIKSGFHKCGEDNFAVESSVAVGKHAPHLIAYGPDHHPCSGCPARSFVQDFSRKLSLPCASF